MFSTELWSLLLLVGGFYPILKFVWEEYALGKSKQQSEGEGVRFTWSEQLEYRLDYHLSSSVWAKPLLLMGFTFVLIVLGSLLLTMVDDLPVSVSAWLAWTYVADPGTHADAEGLGHKVVSFIITIGGMLVFALLIGIISEVIGEKVDDLKEGKARVLETDHTLILGWSDKALAIIQEIAFANESEGGGIIVILAEEPKEEMEEILGSAVEAREHGLKLLGSKVIFRSGNPRTEKALHQVSASTARSIIALSPDDLDPDEADSRMIRQVLALKALHNLQCHVVVEMQDIDNQNLVSLVEPNICEVVVAHDVIGRLMIQCSRSPGLANVIEELIGFQGSEFYFDLWPELVGKSFFDLTCRFDDAIPAGVKTADGKILVNPDNDYILKEGDKLLSLAEDNDSYSVNDGSFPINKQKKMSGSTPPVHKEKMLFCGWRRDMADMIKQLDEYVHEGSELWLFNAVPTKERRELFLDKGNKAELTTENLTIKHAVGNPIVRRDLLRLQASDESGATTGEVAYLDDFDSLLILADVHNGTDMQSSDSRSLSSVLIIQDIQQKLHAQHKKEGRTVKPLCAPISEILDTRTRSLLSVANCTSYVMSNQIISSLIAQIAEERDLNTVLSHLLCADGSEIYLRGISSYIDFNNGAEESFWDIAVQARCMGQLAIGYKRRDDGFKVILNPPDKAGKLQWTRDDEIIVMAIE